MPSASQAITDILGGRVHAMIDAVPAMRGAIEGGQLKPLAVATKKRLPNFPNLPTVAETIPGFEAVGWLALMAPPGTPAPLARRISDDLRKVLAAAGVPEALRGPRHLHPPDHARGTDRLHPRAAADLAAGDRRDGEEDQVKEKHAIALGLDAARRRDLIASTAPKPSPTRRSS